MDHVKMCEKELMNVFNFVYLGHCFQADGDSRHGVEVRMAKAKARFGQLHNVWRSSALSIKLKLLLYKHAVVSVLVHAQEAWKLTRDMVATLNGWNARCVSVITGRHIAEEAGRRQTFDLVSHLRVRRLRWVGHVLRMEDGRMPKEAIRALHGKQTSGKLTAGSLLMDAPKCKSFDELTNLSGQHGNHEEWDTLVNALKKRETRER